jgi:hypothetical protein
MLGYRSYTGQEVEVSFLPTAQFSLGLAPYSFDCDRISISVDVILMIL